MEKKQEILKVENLKQYFKLGSGRNKAINKAVDDISFTINKGEVFSLVGESGCGKTTTGRTIIKLYNSSGGNVHFEGVRIIADLKRTKKEHVAKVKELKEDKLNNINKLKEQKLNGKLTEAAYNEKLSIVKNTYQEGVKASLVTLNAAKYDKKFMKHVDEESLAKLENLDKQPEYKEIVKYYSDMKIQNKARLAVLRKNESKANKSLENADGNKTEFNSELKTAKEEIKQLNKEIKINGIRQKQDISNLKYRFKHKNKLLMRKMQMIFQDPIASLNPRMTVKEIVAEGLRINGFKNETIIDQRVKEALDTVGLVPEHASRYPHEFSGGQRQRIGIARALVVEPSFIIADEPISALDVSIRAQVINLLNDLREKKGITILFIAHDLSVVKYFTDRLAVMYFGKIVEIGSKEAIFNNPLHPYTKTLLESIPLPDPNYERTRKKRPRYNAALEHDYKNEAPKLREIEPDHLILCDSKEFEKYKKQIEANKNETK